MRGPTHPHRRFGPAPAGSGTAMSGPTTSGTAMRASVTPEDDRPVIAVANRLPLHRGEDGWELAPGGLVTALRPVMAAHPGAWVGWDGGTKGMPTTLPDSRVSLLPIALSAAQVRDYYRGFANATMWPLLHNAIEKPRFERSWWNAYQEVNRVFADRAQAAADEHPDAITWVHDYHLMMVPQLIRNQRPEAPIGFFLHVPWPSPDIYARLPWREQILWGLLGADVVAFHTDDYRYNFLRSCVRQLADSGLEVRGSGVVLPDGRTVTTATAPISIDAGEFASFAAEPEVKDGIAALEDQFAGRVLLLGADRLDYTKGIIERLLAVEMLLERDPEMRTSVAFLQLAVPSRDDVREYRQLRGIVEQHVGRINGRFTQPGSDVPVHYLYRGLSPQQLAAYYAAADVLLVTPLIDGMNLVCKEYVTVQQAAGGSGALVLSEFTGAAVELPQAVLCNPFDVEGLSYRIEQAIALKPDARRKALAAMAEQVRVHDVHAWVSGQLTLIAARGAAAAGNRR
ncbi:trehalose-6-phosphate synthase [Trebonia kvetii]|uniref:Trehalose-6-phosphate synthase n=2 Tax=Trebonia kvetii TaxID=2480626 RepID=A0A6P2BQT9_9ACTN|nr:trehalose-6-phosphate synthase [Trebonia kvetii]